MKRLTTDDEKSIVFHLNTFYAKNGEVWVRGGGPYPDFQDVTLVQWIRSASSKHGLSFTAADPEHLGDEMYDALQDGDETVEGILALMHEAAVQAAEMRGRLNPIEDILGDDYDLGHLRELVETDRQAWVSVNDRMPTKREDVLVCAFWHEKWGVYKGWYAGHCWYVSCGIGERNDVQVSHWMPLPEPPEEE